MKPVVKYVCLKCGNETVIPVALSEGVQLYSCMEEGCEWEAQLLIMMNAGIFVSYNNLLDTTIKMWKEHEQDKIQKG